MKQIVRKYIANLSLLLGVISLLSVVIFATSSNVAAGEMVYQKPYVDGIYDLQFAFSLFE